MSDTARDLWRIARELRGGEAAAWLTTVASVWIVLAATLSVLRRVGRGLAALWGRLRGKGKRPDDRDDFPEGA